MIAAAIAGLATTVVVTIEHTAVQSAMTGIVRRSMVISS
jgi:hypothetical protein